MRAVFFDRDGVLNEAPVEKRKPRSPRTLEEMQIAADAPAALQALKTRGFLLLCITNQPNVPRGIQSKALVEAMHQRLCAELPLTEVFVCYHDDADACECRKPQPGLLLQAAARYGIDLAASFMIGDRWKDIEAGRRAGCRTIFLNHDYDDPPPDPPADATVRSLREAADWIQTLP